MSLRSLQTPGRIAMVAGSALLSMGAFIADWNETHVKNPRWPPHARFHNGQTMTFGVLLLLLVTYLLSKNRPPTSGAKTRQKSDELPSGNDSDIVWIAAIVGSLYSIAGFSGILYPGADWKDPDIEGPNAIQIYVFGGQLVINWVGYWLETHRMKHIKQS